ITNTNADTVRVAIDMFSKLGLMEIWDDGTLFMVETQNMIGSETRWAKKKRLQREKQKELPSKKDNVQVEGDIVPSLSPNCPTDIDTEIDIDIELDKDIDIDIDKEPPVPYEKIKELYNSICKSLSQVRSISSTRKNHLKARWKQFKYELDTFREAFEKVEASKFCTGTNDRGWKADFDWLIKNDNNMVKVLEGKYDDKGGGDDFTKDNKTTTGEFYDFSNY
uniref:phage replisome organizer N-terminal domain-containing protein n=1 Tax=Clostridium cochlearium TaxID=1494 RepID=UPI000BBC79F9